MTDEIAQHEIVKLNERIATLEQLLAVHERSAKEKSEQLDKARRESQERAELLAQSEEELRRQASIFRLVLDSMTDGVAVVDERGELMLRNPAAERMLGRGSLGVAAGHDDGVVNPSLFFPDQTTAWPASEHPLVLALRGEPVDQLEIFARKPSEAEQSAARAERRSIAAGSSTIAPAASAAAEDAEPRSVRTSALSEMQLKGDDSSGLFLTVTATPMRRKDGAISGAVAVFRDATERKRLVEDLEAKNRDLIESESAKTELVERLRYAIDEISTPILELWDDVLALPIIGVVDSRRSGQIMERLLDEIVRRQSRYVIIDVTGVEVIDTRTADHFLRLMKAVELLGAKCRVTGVRPAVAQTLVELGIDLGGVRSSRNLKHALREGLAFANASRKPSFASLTGAGRGASAPSQGRPGGWTGTSDGVEATLGQPGPGQVSQQKLNTGKETST